MTETSNLALPLLQPAQAQKHVTVNEAMARLDGLTHLTLVSVDETVPPVGVADGVSYGVPSGAVNEWDGHAGEVAIQSNGGWVFVAPQAGWRAWIADQSTSAIHSGAGWLPAAVSMSPMGAASLFKVIEFDHVIGAGETSHTSVGIPNNALVFSITGRVKTTITGTLISWKLGTDSSPIYYGNNWDLPAGSEVVGTSIRPLRYSADTPLLLSAHGGDFVAGEVRLAIHYYDASAPAV